MKELDHFIHKNIDRVYYYLNSLYVPAGRVQRYGLVLLLTVLFFLIKTTLSVTLHRDIPFLFSLFIVILSAWFGGFGPGILATFLSGLLTHYFFLEPKLTFFSGTEDLPNLIFLILFLLEGLFISILSESRRRNDRQKSEFIGVISHELKNPLTSVKGYSELLKKNLNKKKDFRLSEFAERMESQIDQVTIMINDLLDITKIETGRLTYQDEIFNVEELVKEVISDQQVTTKTHKIVLKGKSSKKINGDRYRVGQVLTNLISNAIKYSPNKDKVLLTLKSGTKNVIISIKDFGVGISDEDQEKLFHPFFRAGNTQVAKGTGIGLYITSEIIKRHKGRIWVQSKPKKGSTFFLELPTID